MANDQQSGPVEVKIAVPGPDGTLAGQPFLGLTCASPEVLAQIVASLADFQKMISEDGGTPPAFTVVSSETPPTGEDAP